MLRDFPDFALPAIPNGLRPREAGADATSSAADDRDHPRPPGTRNRQDTAQLPVPRTRPKRTSRTLSPR